MTPAELAPVVTTQGTEYTLWALFMRADIVVKTVMVGLVLASVWSWGIMIDKWMQIGGATRRAKAFEDQLWSGKPLEQMEESLSQKGGNDPMSRMFLVAAREWRSLRQGPMSAAQAQDVQTRVERLMTGSASRDVAQLEKGVGILASIASAAPFIGLFGTVWGIMNSFRAIAATGQSNLAVVAPGMAEALFATAIGLFAAIPALIFYNKLVGDLDRLTSRLEVMSDEISVRLSRRLSERAGA